MAKGVKGCPLPVQPSVVTGLESLILDNGVTSWRKSIMKINSKKSKVKLHQIDDLTTKSVKNILI